ncbi:MAG: hypothetical protein H6917_06445 [Novosphingobium sp.]|nr:hypothetical protein [Novosphingobium sp.]
MAWLIYNAASGRNDPEALAMLDNALGEAGCNLERKIRFPEEDAPEISELRERGVDLVVIFAGDGTISSVVTGLFGWEGRLLVLPGGTMNLLSRRLHGEASAGEIIARLGGSNVRKVRPTIVSSRSGYALTGVLAGPGTAERCAAKRCVRLTCPKWSVPLPMRSSNPSAEPRWSAAIPAAAGRKAMRRSWSLPCKMRLRRAAITRKASQIMPRRRRHCCRGTFATGPMICSGPTNAWS